jgi:hypothetical protein
MMKLLTRTAIHNSGSNISLAALVARAQNTLSALVVHTEDRNAASIVGAKVT